MIGAGGAPAPAPRDLAQDQWRGNDIGGKTILLHAEQGFGDVIQFARYIPMVAAKGAKLILEVLDALMPLLARLDGMTAMVARGSPLPPFDLHCPQMSLPLAVGTTLSTIPAAVPDLRVPDERMKDWRARLPRTSRALASSGRASRRTTTTTIAASR